MNAPMISVIIPVYNTEEYIERCVQSVLGQTFQYFEIILVNDGSTDQSGAVCSRLAEAYDKIKVIHQENQGVSVARNRGLEESCGTYISFIDSDDWLEPEMYQRMVDAMLEYDSDIAACDFNEVRIQEDNEKDVLRKNVWGKYKSDTVLSGRQMMCELCRTMTLWNKLIKRSLIAESCFDQELSYGEDAYFFMQQLIKASSAVVVPYYGYNYFINRGGNVVSAPLCKKDKDCIETEKKIYCLAKEAGTPEAGVLRIYYSVGNILRKMKQGTSGDEKEYLVLCRDTARVPGMMEVYRFFRYYGVAKRFLVMRVAPALLLRC